MLAKVKKTHFRAFIVTRAIERERAGTHPEGLTRVNYRARKT